MLKRFLILLAVLPAPVFAAENPFFGNKENQIMIGAGHGTSAYWLLPFPGHRVQFEILGLSYSQPNAFFRLPGRQSINIAQTIGWGRDGKWDWKDYANPMIYLSEDVALFGGEKWYFGTGIGMGMQMKENERIGTKLLFQLKFFFGFRLSDKWRAEFFNQHFSNGNTSENNNSYNFYGLGFARSF